MKLPNRQDFLDYAEGVSGQDQQLQKQILSLLASSSLMREQLAEVKKDLYMVDMQIPDYMPSATFGAEITRLTQAWMKLSYSRQFSFKNFYRSHEFFLLALSLISGVAFLLALLGFGLMR